MRSIFMVDLSFICNGNIIKNMTENQYCKHKPGYPKSEYQIYEIILKLNAKEC